MSHIFSSIESFFRALSASVPLEVFVFVGSLVEELVSPIPSTLIMGTAGSAASASEYAIIFLFWLSFVGNTGKIIGSIFYYMLGDKLEDVVVRKFGKYLGVTHQQVEGLGKRFSGHWRDGITLFFLRLLPFVPTTPVSLACGIIRMPMKTFAIATFAGNFVKDFLYLLIGYMGFAAVRDLFHRAAEIRYYLDIAILFAFVSLLFLLWYHRKRGVWLWQWCRGRCGKFFCRNEKV
jgi:membrane protein DedA with SNARE-associated domain